jgi:hypothetical protein
MDIVEDNVRNRIVVPLVALALFIALVFKIASILDTDLSTPE